MAVAISNINICQRDCDCCIAKIYASIYKNADEWKEVDEMRFAETPLHQAAAVGNTAAAVEILNLMPSLGRKLNKGGLSPLHLAIEGAHRDTAWALARSDKQLVRVKGRKGMTPLMQCAARADHDDLRLLARLLVSCPESVADLNNSHQTVVHVALEHRHCGAVCVLVDWLRRRDRIASVLSIKDHKGDTVLHAAAQFGCVRGTRKMVDLVKLNRVNYEKQTALDVAIAHNQHELVEILEKRGAKRSCDIFPPQTKTDYVLTEATFSEKISRAFYHLNLDLTLEMRNAILVVATLIVAATYQGVLQPPGGLYPPPQENNSTIPLHHHHHMGRRLGNNDPKQLAGHMVLEKSHFLFFLSSNTFAFALSAVIIIFVAPCSPIFLILHLCLVFMCLGYLIALDAITRSDTIISHMIFVMALCAILGAYIFKLLYYMIKALLVDEDWWLRSFSVKFANYSSSSGGDPDREGVASAAMKIANTMKKQHQILSLE